MCLLALLYGYFASVLVGVAASSAISASALAVKGAIAAYGLWNIVVSSTELRMVVRWCAAKWRAAFSAPAARPADRPAAPGSDERPIAEPLAEVAEDDGDDLSNGVDDRNREGDGDAHEGPLSAPYVMLADGGPDIDK